jgi:hypothetical protein
LLGKKLKNLGHHQPPKNKITKKTPINNILLYSAKKNKAKITPEYSTLKPATNSASASGKSKGALLVSANIEMKKITIKGNKGKKYQISDCFSIISIKFKEPEQRITASTVKPKETSYEIICAADLKAPNKAYLELLAQPPNKTP